MTLFIKFLKNNAPTTPWTKLVRLTRYNDKPLQENEKSQDEYGIYKLGITIIKMSDQYKLVSRTVEGSEEKLNSEALFTNNGKFISGTVNVFISYMDDDDGSYHDELLKELLDTNHKIKWDLIE
jgi:hypothetical protein